MSEPRNCAECGEPFTPKLAKQVYCQRTCQTRAHTRRTLARKRAAGRDTRTQFQKLADARQAELEARDRAKPVPMEYQLRAKRQRLLVDLKERVR